MRIDKTQWFKDWINNIEDLDIPKDWIDSTWHNDATCSFIKNKKQIWIDNKDVEQSTDYNDLSQEDYDRFHIILSILKTRYHSLGGNYFLNHQRDLLKAHLDYIDSKYSTFHY